PSCAPAIEYVAMPDGSSSAAPVTSPGPRTETNRRTRPGFFGTSVPFLAGGALLIVLDRSAGSVPEIPGRNRAGSSYIQARADGDANSQVERVVRGDASRRRSGAGDLDDGRPPQPDRVLSLRHAADGRKAQGRRPRARRLARRPRRQGEREPRGGNRRQAPGPRLRQLHLTPLPARGRARPEDVRAVPR